MSDAGDVLREACEKAVADGRYPSRAAIARAAGMHPSALTRALRPGRRVSPDTIARVARLLGLEVALVPLRSRT